MAELSAQAKQQRAILLILLATCERALEALQAADNRLDDTFVVDIEKLIGRTQRELAAIDDTAGT